MIQYNIKYKDTSKTGNQVFDLLIFANDEDDMFEKFIERRPTGELISWTTS